MKFDIAITAYKRPEQTLRAIASCLSQQGGWLGKVIVVDDASGDGTAERIESLGDHRVLLVRRLVNGGISAARHDAYAQSTADWVISLDSDHELLPNALQHLAEAAVRVGNKVGILGAKYRWDDGRISPERIPQEAIDYVGRAQWSSLPDSIGMDYLCAISSRVRNQVKWSTLRGGVADTLFQLDIARVSNAIFLNEVLAIQYAEVVESHTRGTAINRLRRRNLDAVDTVILVELIVQRHGQVLRTHGVKLYASVLSTGSLSALLSERRWLAIRWAFLSVWTSCNFNGLQMLLGALLGKTIFSLLYKMRGSK